MYNPKDDHQPVTDEIKYEYDYEISKQCSTCLSTGRTLKPLNELTDIFNNLINYCKYTVPVSLIQMCWECRSLLNKVAKFKRQVEKANTLLQIGQSHIYSLSNLISTSQTDLRTTIYIQEIKSVENTIKSNEATDNDNEDLFETFQTENSKMKIKKTNSKSKWAIKRLKQNKKEKFKIVSGVFDDIFIRIKKENSQVNNEKENNSKSLKEKKYKCNECCLEFNSYSLWKKHYDKHVGKTNFICELCKLSFTTKNRLAKHINMHYYMYKCKVCMFVCHKEQADRHAKKHKRLFECSKCMLKYESRREFFKHFKDAHEKFICDYCGISFKMRYCIKNHIRKRHSPHSCGICDKKFTSYNGVWVHNRVIHRPVPTYYNQDNTNRPRKSYRIPCPECKKIFTKNIYMKDHFNLVHMKIFKYRCEQCNKNFIRNAELTKHIKRIHEKIMPEKNKMCYVCGRGFTTNSILWNHIRTHTGERPFVCLHCDARFTQNASLKSHCKSKHGIT